MFPSQLILNEKWSLWLVSTRDALEEFAHEWEEEIRTSIFLSLFLFHRIRPLIKSFLIIWENTNSCSKVLIASNYCLQQIYLDNTIVLALSIEKFMLFENEKFCKKTRLFSCLNGMLKTIIRASLIICFSLSFQTFVMSTFVNLLKVFQSLF